MPLAKRSFNFGGGKSLILLQLTFLLPTLLHLRVESKPPKNLTNQFFQDEKRRVGFLLISIPNLNSIIY